MIGRVASDKGCTPGQVTLAFVHALGDDVAPIPGTKRRAYLEENVAALDVELTEEDLAALHRRGDGPRRSLRRHVVALRGVGHRQPGRDPGRGEPARGPPFRGIGVRSESRPG